jgi:hypothetical protein
VSRTAVRAIVVTGRAPAVVPAVAALAAAMKFLNKDIVSPEQLSEFVGWHSRLEPVFLDGGLADCEPPGSAYSR